MFNYSWSTRENPTLIEIAKLADYLRCAREIEATLTTEVVARLAVLSSFTSEFLRPYLIVEADRLRPRVLPWFAPSEQFERQVFESDSALWAEPREVIWIAMRVEDVEPTLVDELPEIGPTAAAHRLRAIRERLVALAGGIRERSTAAILVSNFACPASLDTFDASDPDGLVHLVSVENRELARSLTRIAGAHVFDWGGLQAELGRSALVDSKMWYLARAPVAVASQPELARRLARAIRALCLPSAKCVVVDLDNTLWGGVLGDDGLEGIQLGGGYPGSVFKDVQHLLKQLQRRGFLLAIASKNEETLVRKVLDLHPEMVLRPADFASVFVNWEPKATNLRRIAKMLNIGLDALVFVDDNPVERAQVRAELPMVHVVELPFEPLGYLDALRDVAFLDRPRLLADDRTRAAMYAQEVCRHEMQQSNSSTEEYLRDLRMVATVGKCDTMTIERIHQLINKTNQFNLTTRRHSLGEVSRLAGLGGAAVCWLRLRDRFGDLGLVCVGILQQIDGMVWEIDTFLMSCRVMGRQVEEAFLTYLLEVATDRGARRVHGIYQPNEKNRIVANFYPQHGFSLAAQLGEETVYELNLDLGRPMWPSLIERVDHKSVA